MRSRHTLGPISAVLSHLMPAGWTLATLDDWKGPLLATGEYDVQWTSTADALVSAGEAQGLLEDFQESLATQQRVQLRSTAAGQG
eukprot:913815-Pyramimonas_sp.AAC.1